MIKPCVRFFGGCKNRYHKYCFQGNEDLVEGRGEKGMKQVQTNINVRQIKMRGTNKMLGSSRGRKSHPCESLRKV